MRPGRSDRDLAAELEAERANTEHWRLVARQRTESYEELKHRRLVRGALAVDRVARPVVVGAAARLRRFRRRSEQAALAVSALGLRGSVGRAGSATTTAPTRELSGSPGPQAVSVAVVLVGEPRPELAAGLARDAVEVIRVDPTGGESVGRAVQRAIDAASSDLVCILSGACDPVGESWATRLAARVDGDVVAATATLVHPRREWRTATPHDGRVREMGLDIVLIDGVPAVRARAAGEVSHPRDPEADVAAVSAACVIFHRARLRAAGGFAAETVDLDIGTVELCARLRERGGRIVVVPSVVAIDHRPVSSFRELRGPVGDDDAEWRRAIERTGPALVAHTRSTRPMPTTFAITVASPSAKVAAQWGDTHLANALAESLQARGHAVVVQTADRADDPRGRVCDVHVVVRGLTPVRRTSGQRHVVWIISHPEAIEDSELDDADLVLVASPVFAAHLQERTATPVEVLLQATDQRRFRPRTPDPRHRHPITVVAKTRDVLRPVVADALAVGLRPSIYGSGWRDLVDARLVVADHVDNDELPVVYSSAGVVLNDHWRTMQAWGFVSNRLFDVLACGAPVISDPVAGIVELFDGAVLEYRSPDGLRELVDQVLADPEAARARAGRGRAAVLAAHTFDHRAAELVAALRRHVNSP